MRHNPMQNAAMEKHSREPNSYFGLAVAFTVLAGSLAVNPISGGCFNPAIGTGVEFATLFCAMPRPEWTWQMLVNNLNVDSQTRTGRKTPCS